MKRTRSKQVMSIIFKGLQNSCLNACTSRDRFKVLPLWKTIAQARLLRRNATINSFPFSLVFYAGLMDLQLKNCALLVVALGWLASSQTMQELLRGNLRIAITATIAVVILATIYIVWVVAVYSESQRSRVELKKLAFMPEAYFSGHFIKSTLVVCLCGTMLALYGLVIALTWMIYATPARS
jgi:hypothetical protein